MTADHLATGSRHAGLLTSLALWQSSGVARNLQEGEDHGRPDARHLFRPRQPDERLEQQCVHRRLAQDRRADKAAQGRPFGVRTLVPPRDRRHGRHGAPNHPRLRGLPPRALRRAVPRARRSRSRPPRSTTSRPSRSETRQFMGSRSRHMVRAEARLSRRRYSRCATQHRRDQAGVVSFRDRQEARTASGRRCADRTAISCTTSIPTLGGAIQATPTTGRPVSKAQPGT
jgi:hypothetical protein